MVRTAPWLVLRLVVALFPGDERKPAASETAPPVARPTCVGGQACVACHPWDTELWKGSDHARAMQPANSTTVLGDFDHVTFEKDGVTSTFFRRDGDYFVRTDGPDGRLREYKLAYTFGVDPLQQYLIAFPNGRYQALSLAWDTCPAAVGGQRWFHLYPHEKIDHRDILHLMRTVEDTTLPAIVRATALSLLPQFLGPQSFRTVERSLRGRDPLVRRPAAVLAAVEPRARVAFGLPLLRDPHPHRAGWKRCRVSSTCRDTSIHPTNWRRSIRASPNTARRRP